MQPDYCSSFQEEAERVWRDMSDAAHFGISRNEETTTETLLLNLAKKHSGRGLTIKTFTKDEERDHGADWGFWFVDSSNLGVAVRVQAKRIDRKSGKYNQLWHPFKGTSKTAENWSNQCEALLRNSKGAVPLYVLYNDDSLAKAFVRGKNWPFYLMKHGPFPIANAACGICAASAIAIRDADWGRRNRPGQFPMVPWHELVCYNPSSTSLVSPTLPTLIGRGLSRLFVRDTGVDLDEAAIEDEFGFSFTPSKNVPEWVNMLQSLDDRDENLSRYMDDTNLKGVAIIQETEARDD